jgi:hypothetical protein
MAGHGIEEGAGAKFQPLAGGGAQGTNRSLLILRTRSRGWKGEVGVAVDERGHDNAPGSVDLDRIARPGEILDAAGRPHFLDYAIAYEHGAVVNDTKVAE